MDSTGSIMCPLSAASMIPVGRKTSEQTSKSFCLGRLQPDFLAFSPALKRIAVIDLCSSSEVHPDQLSVVFTQKKTSYSLDITQIMDGQYKFFHGWWESEASWM
jgi:hypothetical protein